MPVTHFDQLDLSRQYTYADYLTWQFQERVELLRGWVAKMSPAPNRRHQRVSGRLHGELYQLFKQHSCYLYEAPFDVRLPRTTGGETVVQPDLCVFCDREKLTDQGATGAPDWVIEILSPGNSARELADKFSLYEEVGVREYWLVHPMDEVILRYILRDGEFVGLAPHTRAMGMLRSEIFEFVSVDVSILFEDD